MKDVLVLAVAVLSTNTVFGLGLATPNGEITFDNLRIGCTYRFSEFAGDYYKLIIKGEEQGAVKVELIAAQKDELKPGYEQLPDMSWVALSKSELVGSPTDPAKTDFIISIPDNQEYFGKKYQFYVWSTVAPVSDKGFGVGVGVKSRVLISIAPVAADPDEKKLREKQSFMKQPLVIVPLRVSADNAQLGKETAFEIKLINCTDKQLKIKLANVPVEKSPLVLTEGYAKPPSKLKLVIKPNKVTVDAGTIVTVPVSLAVPSDKKLADKKFMFVINAAEESALVNTGSFIKVLIGIIK
jgi:hypothetical protein